MKNTVSKWMEQREQEPRRKCVDCGNGLVEAEGPWADEWLRESLISG